MTGRSLSITAVEYPLEKAFGISRGSKTVAKTVQVSLSEGEVTGRGECVPYGRYGESVESVSRQISDVMNEVCEDVSRDKLSQLLPAGAARNAIDCAIWDLEAKRSGQSVFGAVGIKPKEVMTAFTIPYADVATMRTNAAENAFRPMLKIKLGSPDDRERLIAVAQSAPNAKLVVDANEGWSLDDFRQMAPLLHSIGVVMVEQPLPAGQDADLKASDFPFVLCADESCHTRETLPALVGRYDMINIKLDKTGGLTEALALKDAAEAIGLKIMIGCMVGSSLSMAPAMVVAQTAEIVDLDAPLLLASDIEDGLQFDGSTVMPPTAKLWG